MLVVEVLSPSTEARDRAVKARRDAALGIRHYWLVDPEARRLECYRAVAGRYERAAEAEDEAVLVPRDWPDLALRLGELWR